MTKEVFLAEIWEYIKNQIEFMENKPKVWIGVMIFKDGKILLGERKGSHREVELKEPDKCRGWSWYDIEDLPEPLFYMVKLAVESYKTNQIYFERE